MSREHPPQWAEWLLDHLLPDAEEHAPLGDFEEVWHEFRQSDGPGAADRWYILSVLGLVLRRIVAGIRSRLSLFANEVKAFSRSMQRHRVYSAITVLSLTSGTACFLLISLYVLEESSFDRFHTDAERIYRINTDYMGRDYTFSNALSSASVGPAVERVSSDVESVTRISRVASGAFLESSRARVTSEEGLYADSNFFSVFSFPLLTGDADRALSNPDGIVLTASLARRLFRDPRPIGRTVWFDAGRELTITAIAADPPVESHIGFDYVLPLAARSPIDEDDWFDNPFYTFVVLPPGTTSQSVAPALRQLTDEHLMATAEAADISMAMWLQPLLDIRLHPRNNDLSNGPGEDGLLILSGIALFILLLGCINFSNLSSARWSARYREVGMRNVMGASRSQLVQQVFTESVMLGTLATAFGLVVALSFVPWFESLVGRAVSFSLDWPVVILVTVAAVISGMLAGVIPAALISRLQPVHVLKGRAAGTTQSGSLLRNALVAFQFSVSVVLILVSVMTYRQVVFMQGFDVGLDRKEILAVQDRDELPAGLPSVSDRLMELPDVVDVAWASRAPGEGALGTLVQRADIPDSPLTEHKLILADERYLNVLRVPVVAGRWFRDADDGEQQLVVNEAALADLGWVDAEHALGHRLTFEGGQSGEIVGVVKNFRFQPLRVGMQPVLFRYQEAGDGSLLIRLGTTDVERAIAEIESVWNDERPERPFTATLLEETFRDLYAEEERYGRMILGFTLLAIVLAGMGIFGLATFDAVRRRREVGIRKALGATSERIALLLSRRYLALLLISNVFAGPVAWLYVRHWQQNFVHQVSFSPGIYALAVLVSLAIVGLATGIQTVQAAATPPVTELKAVQ